MTEKKPTNCNFLQNISQRENQNRNELLISRKVTQKSFKDTSQIQKYGRQKTCKSKVETSSFLIEC